MIFNKKKIGIFIGIICSALLGIYVLARKKKNDSVYENEPDQKNPLEGKKVVFIEDNNDPENADGLRGHLKAIGESEYKQNFYSKFVKRGMDIILSFCGLVILSPVYAGIALAIKIDDPGPVFFTQKRLGQNKQYFKLHKFRSMKMSTPHDVPTHMLDNPDQYITKVGKFLRAHSLDELPQIWDIFIGNMSVIGPRPGLWNQDILTAERDKYSANDIKPGLTGWAQINGRDELEIPEKAKLDGDYVKNIGLKMDIKCFLGSIHVFGRDDSVVEGGTGKIEKEKMTEEDNTKDEDKEEKLLKRILITGSESYIGTSVETYLEKDPDKYIVDTIDVKNPEWKNADFSKYDVVFHVAGIAHQKETDENAHLYYEVNERLAIDVAKKAEKEGVKQFIILSSMSVYGKENGHITKKTVPDPKTHYGISKNNADIKISELATADFKIAILRPPMVYGNGCKGNYQRLRQFALKSPIFPNYDNARSVIYIGNLCEFVKQVIDGNKAGLFFPQNEEYMCTSSMVKEIATLNGKNIRLTRIFNPLIRLIPAKTLKKVFGSLTYEKVDTIKKFDFKTSMKLSEDKMMNELEFDIKDVQQKMLDILVYFRDFCDQHNLKFVLAGGTCLGAVRHKGFIPWDDDVDVFMLRSDYEKLIELWNKYANTERYSCVRSNDKVNIHHSATEIKDNKTTFINKHSKDLDINQGVMIDVIPLDYVGNSKKDKIVQYLNALIYCCFNFQRLPEHKGKTIYFVTKIALTLVKSPKLRYKIWKNAEKNLIKHGSVLSKKVASFGEGFSIMQQEIPIEWIEYPEYLEFEKMRMPVIKNYDEWLTMAYGDYMQLPPEEERVYRHDLVFVDLDNSYKKYKGKYYCTEKK